MKTRKFRISRILSLACLLLLMVSGALSAQELTIKAVKVTGSIPLDPYNKVWKRATPTEVALAPQAITTPSIFEAKVSSLKARAIHNGKEIAFLVEWNDDTQDAGVNMDQYSDAAGLQFPSSAASGKDVAAAFMMGDQENIVNIWFWKAAYQQEASPSKTYYTPDALLSGVQKVDPAAKPFLGGLQAGNPVSQPKPSPVSNLTAQGFGTLTAMPSGKPELSVGGIGKWKANTWSVVFKRVLKGGSKYEADFKPGGTSPVAFTVWNGAEGHRGARKVFSTWYEVSLGK